MASSGQRPLVIQKGVAVDVIVVAGRGQLNNRDYFTRDRQTQTAL